MLNLIIIFSLLLLRAEHQPTVLHSGFLPSDPRQEIVQQAYLMGGIDFLALLECENGNWDTETLGDGEDRATDCVSLIRDDTGKQSDLTFQTEKFSFLFATGSGKVEQSSTVLRGGSEGRDAQR